MKHTIYASLQTAVSNETLRQNLLALREQIQDAEGEPPHIQREPGGGQPDGGRQVAIRERDEGIPPQRVPVAERQGVRIHFGVRSSIGQRCAYGQAAGDLGDLLVLVLLPSPSPPKMSRERLRAHARDLARFPAIRGQELRHQDGELRPPCM